MAEIKYKRVLLKLSGEMLAGEHHGDRKASGYDTEALKEIAAVIKKCVDVGVEMAIVVGGGNIWRGRDDAALHDRIRSDNMGMLATTMNALALCDFLEQEGLPARVLSALQMPVIAEQYNRNTVLHHIQRGRVLIFAGGTGNPCFSTDSAAALRAIEIGADIIFKATNVDGVYSGDPKKDPNAVRLADVTYSEILKEQYKFMDLSAAAMCQDKNMPVLVFDVSDPENIYKACFGEARASICHK